MRTYTVFYIIGYEEERDNGALLVNASEFALIDVSYENAIKRAKKLFKKRNYRLRQIVEYPFQTEGERGIRNVVTT